ncbi:MULTISPECIES: phage/plasmid primase, P4 family [Flavobacterium]|uniref:DNA primase family protein n=1 Tax=Flavobacterium TaxID=237 RepID=UPI00211425B7|nr:MULTISPECIES: phage/plasmid primase, P4 family [Flavobacterium]UUF15201.1 phage/plasmid primase, P4 family [Flavobacterium panici]
MESNKLYIEEETDFNDIPLKLVCKDEKTSLIEKGNFKTWMQLGIKKESIINELLEEAPIIDFEFEANGDIILLLREELKNAKHPKESERIEKQIQKIAPNNPQKYVIIIRKLLELAQQIGIGIGISNNLFYYYNRIYWKQKDHFFLNSFLGDFAQKSGLGKLEAQQSKVKIDLMKQFQSDAEIPDFNKKSNEIRIPLKNGTLIFKNGQFEQTGFKMEHFSTYQLPFEYNPEAKAYIFQKFLDRVLPNKELQKILLEFIGYCFVKKMKLEKMLLLFGNGRNGKSVVNEIIHSLLGEENVTSFSVTSLCDPKSQTRPLLENNLLNCSQEFGTGKFDLDIFKTLVSNQKIEAKKLYQNPYTIENYGRMISNCNTLPRVTENKDAFYRRLIILPFKVKIPEDEIDINLANKIISNELPGIFNMVIEGMKRLVEQNNFTYSEITEEELKKYRRDSNSVLTFLDDENYIPSKTEKVKISDFFEIYQNYCIRNNYQSFSSVKFNDQLRDAGYEISRSTGGFYYLYYGKKNFDNNLDNTTEENISNLLELFLPKKQI